MRKDLLFGGVVFLIVGVFVWKYVWNIIGLLTTFAGVIQIIAGIVRKPLPPTGPPTLPVIQYCIKCGAMLSVGATFCQKCGAAQ